MYFELKLCELFMFYPCAVTCDYLARYYSLCDIGILAPVFVMVISFGFVSAMSSGFVSVIVMWP